MKRYEPEFDDINSDNILEIDRVLSISEKHRNRLASLCRIMLKNRHISIVNLSNIEVVDIVLSNKQAIADKAFYAACLLRLHSVYPNEINEAKSDIRVSIVKLFDMLPSVLEELEVDPKAQNYERLQTLESAATRAEQYLSEALRLNRNFPSAFNQIRQKILRVYSNPLIEDIIKPFLPGFLLKDNMDVILASIDLFLTSDTRDTPDKYKHAVSLIEEAIELSHSYASYYAKTYFLPFFNELLLSVNTLFRQSPVNLPARLVMETSGRKYPFCITGAEIRFDFSVENIGSGIALDVEISVDTDTCVIIPSPSQYLEIIEPATVIKPVEFHAQVVEPSSTSLWVDCSIRWTNGDGTSGEWEDIFELKTQSADIPWMDLSIHEPYSLEPVCTPDELIGRSEQISRLLAKLNSSSVGSFWIHGQRRVGKTSVVRTLENHDQTSLLTILYLETGSFIDPDPIITINNLGNSICRQLKHKNIKIKDFELPNFNGALNPLDQFLSDAHYRDPDLKLVIVLDEFDEIPYDLYQRDSKISHALFMTFRSLSAKEFIGFIFVGGEKMPEILSIRGEVLNKFRPLRIDYLDRETHWADFVDLVRRPVEKWATITDEAVNRIYDATAGNPFFAKFILGILVADMLKRRDAYASHKEMEKAINSAVIEAGENQFQHFWVDGIIDSPTERSKQERAARRRILIGLGEVLRNRESSTIEQISTRIERHGISHSEVKRILSDFLKRKVLISDAGKYHCKVQLFERWLIDEGISQLALSLVEEDNLRAEIEEEARQRVKNHEIVELVGNWGSYRGRHISDIQVRNWLDQFDTISDRRLMFQLLSKLRFYSGGLIREKLRNCHESVIRELSARGVASIIKNRRARKSTENIIISYYGSEGKRGPTYAKLYVDENKIYSERLVSSDDIVQKLKTFDDIEGVVFVDDFIGTGESIDSNLIPILANISDAVNSQEIDVFLVTISGFNESKEKMKDNISKIIDKFHIFIADPLDDSDKCFSNSSLVFPDDSSRSRAKQIAQIHGNRLVKRNPLGYGDCELAIVFEHTCPNNTLPILWADGSEDEWHPLFPRP